MDVMAEFRDRLRRAGLDPRQVLQDPRVAQLAPILDRMEFLFRTQDFAAKLLENLGRKAPLPRSKKHEYYRQCLARGIQQSFSILIMVHAGSNYDASILNRTLVERALLLPHLTKHDSFEVFADWTFLKSYQHKQKYVRLMGGKGFITPEDRKRYDALRARPEVVGWRFNVRAAAEEAGLLNLYETIYDFASNHVHPRYGEGYDALGYEDDDDDPEEWSRYQVQWAAQSLLLIAATVFRFAGTGVHPAAGEALVCLSTWLNGAKPEDADARHAALVAVPSERLIGYA